MCRRLEPTDGAGARRRCGARGRRAPGRSRRARPTAWTAVPMISAPRRGRRLALRGAAGRGNPAGLRGLAQRLGRGLRRGLRRAAAERLLAAGLRSARATPAARLGRPRSAWPPRSACAGRLGAATASTASRDAGSAPGPAARSAAPRRACRCGGAGGSAEARSGARWNARRSSSANHGTCRSVDPQAERNLTQVETVWPVVRKEMERNADNIHQDPTRAPGVRNSISASPPVDAVTSKKIALYSRFTGGRAPLEAAARLLILSPGGSRAGGRERLERNFRCL